MSLDFTGERIVPGQVDANLWNEHLARYAFASRLARDRRVLDAGCGAGYGSAELANVAASVTAVDVAPEAIAWAQANYEAPELRWTRASVADLPFRAESFDLVISFEVIEHLQDWAKLISEARRVLAPGGQFVVSTPNKSFYAKTRATEGPNPYHEHEFEYEEFREALAAVFPQVEIFLEDPAEGVLFRGADSSAGADVRVESSDYTPSNASFYIAVCGTSPLPAPAPFVYVPRAANLLAEKLVHIERLQGEIAKKDVWLAEAHQSHAQLVEEHRRVQGELEASNRWAVEVNDKLTAAGQYIGELQAELTTRVQEMAAGYEAQIAEMQRELDQRTEWAREVEQRLTGELEIRTADLQGQTAELGRCVEILHQTEATLEERTRWAMQLNEQKVQLEQMVQAAQHSRWVKVGRAIGLGPELNRR